DRRVGRGDEVDCDLAGQQSQEQRPDDPTRRGHQLANLRRDSRAITANATVSASRWSTGRAIPPAWLRAPSSAWRAGLNGNRAQITRMTAWRPDDTAPLGTRARKATGSESRKASS